MSEPYAVVVPKDLYYHEVAYVRGLEAQLAVLKRALKEAWDHIDPYLVEVLARIDAALSGTDAATGGSV